MVVLFAIAPTLPARAFDRRYSAHSNGSADLASVRSCAMNEHEDRNSGSFLWSIATSALSIPGRFGCASRMLIRLKASDLRIVESCALFRLRRWPAAGESEPGG